MFKSHTDQHFGHGWPTSGRCESDTIYFIQNKTYTVIVNFSDKQFNIRNFPVK